MYFNNLIKRLVLKVFNLTGYDVQKQLIGNRFSKRSYSQCGEDSIINYIFSLRGIEYPSYLDIGCNHPYYINNTALFYEKGCRGINIDANPKFIEAFNIERPEDINLNVGISNIEGEMGFYLMEDDTLSTFSKYECDAMVSNGKQLLEIKKVKLVTINKILENHCLNIFPDFLSLDVEGLDFEIIKSIDFDKTVPKVICVEASEYSPIGSGARRNELIDFLITKGYYEYANTNLNAIMIRNDFWFI